MTWIDDDIEEQKRLHQSAMQLRTRESEISIKAGTIFENLWDEILARIQEAEEKQLIAILTNGSPYERKLIVPQPIKPHQSGSYPKVYILALTKGQQAISFKGPDSTIILPFDLGDDKVVRIRHEGEPQTIQDIARSLLRPLLFPELYGPK